MTETLEDFDGINFYREDPVCVNIAGFKLEDPGTKKEGSPMGDLYDIIIFPDVMNNPSQPERFQAILTSPLHYISRMIDDGFLGVVAKVTTTSDNFMQGIHKSMDDLVEVYIKHYEEDQNDEQT